MLKLRSQGSGERRRRSGRRAGRLAGLGAGALVLCALAVAGCGGSGSGGGSSTTGQSEPISLGMGVDPVYAPMYVADAKGYFAREGLKVQIEQFAQGGEAVDGVIAGTVTAAAATPTSIMAKAPSGDVQALGTFVTDPGTYTYLATRPDITSPDQIKKMGIVPGSIHQWGAIMYLQHHGIDPASVTFVPTGPPELPALLKTGNIDAFVSPEPEPARAQEIADAKLTPAKAWGLSYTLVVAARQDWIASHQSDARALMKALGDGAKYAEAHPEETAEMIEERTKIPKAITLKAISGMDFGTRGWSDKDKSALEFQVKFLEQQKLVKGTPDLDAFMSGTVVKDGA